jgi:hypothetical protein
MTSSRFFLSSAVVTVLISLVSVSIVTSLAPTSKQTYSPSSRHFQISPVPPGADWTS